MENNKVSKGMREIKFRAWDKKSKTMCRIKVLTDTGADLVGLPTDVYPASVEWVDTHSSIVIPAGERWLPLSQIELMQYTGLKDKNDKEIYEGDIVREDYYTGEVQYHEGYASFGIQWHGDGRIWFSGFGWAEVDDEVIGNIYENPELLEGGEMKQ